MCLELAALSFPCPPPVAAGEAQVLLPVVVCLVVLPGPEMITDPAADRVARFRQLRHAESAGLEQALHRFRMQR